MSVLYCGTEHRRDATRQSSLNGMDFLEVSPSQDLLTVHFLKPIVGSVDVENIEIIGGVRITGIRAISTSISGNELAIKVSRSGDFSTYTLRLVSAPPNSVIPLAGIDPQLSQIEFSFKVACPTDFDCKEESYCPPQTFEPADIDYLAKDYATFRQLMFDRISGLVPAWAEPNPAALESAVVETLAYVADRLSYYQDAVANEAYLGTARLRQSVRRHARLLDYYVHEGCNARAFLCFEVASGQDENILMKGTPVMVADDGRPATISEVDYEASSKELPVFELMHELTLREANNRIAFYTWSDTDCCLPSGATRATLDNTVPLSLEIGSFLVLEEIAGAASGLASDADHEHRHVVRLTKVTKAMDPVAERNVLEVEWHSLDALPFPLCLSATFQNGVKEISVARGNVALADHGRTLKGQPLEPLQVPDNDLYQPVLHQPGLTCEGQYSQYAPALVVMKSDCGETMPALSLRSLQVEWRPRRDLLSSSRFAPEFVAEFANDRVVHLRFGDGVLGQKPSEGSEFKADLRIGNGVFGNVGANRLRCLVSNQPVVTRVWNPMAATGGTDPEPIEDVKRDAPQAFRNQLRAVTVQDWVDRAIQFKFEGARGIQRATAEFRWTGSWYTVFLSVDRVGGRKIGDDVGFRTSLLDYLEQFRIAGYELELRDPIMVPLDVRLFVCAKANAYRSQVNKRVLERLSSRSGGLFHADNYTFGQAVYLSQLVAAVEEVDGVDSVEVQKLQRWGLSANRELATGFIAIAPNEIAVLANDPNFAEHGVIEVTVKGGL